jgi:hypothetical protein
MMSMAEKRFECPECGMKFSTTQGLGSHVKYCPARKREGKDASSSSGEALDLKHDFLRMLEDVGVRRGTKTIVDLFFQLGPDSSENLDTVLRLAGVTNPAKALILRSWSQRTGTEVSETLLRGKEMEEQTGDFFGIYNKAREAELSDLLMEDLRSRIKERRRQSGGGDEFKLLLDKFEKMENELKDLRAQSTQNTTEDYEHTRDYDHRQLPMPHDLYPQRRSKHSTHPCYNPHHLQPCIVCGHCGFHGTIRYIPLGSPFDCPQCGERYLRDH